MKMKVKEALTTNCFGLPKGCPKPIRDLVLVKRLDPEVRSAGGVELAQEAVDPPYKARVLAVGEGWWDQGKFITPPALLIPGCIVFVNRHAGQEFVVETRTADGKMALGGWGVSREKYILCRYDEIAGIFDYRDLEQ